MKFIFRSTKTNEELTMPVTPAGFQVEAGRMIEPLDMAQIGQVNLPGLHALFNEQMDFLLPAERRNYTVSGYNGNPYGIVDKLVGWSKAGEVLRLIITDTPVNVSVLLGPVLYGEHGGAGDVTVSLEIREYRDLAAETTENPATGNTGRSDPPAAKKETSHTVVKGDTLWGIARKHYGSGSLCYKLAKYNGIKNANLIFPGQVVRLPDKSML